MGQNDSISNGDSAVVLADTGYLENVFQKGVTAQHLTLTLYKTHLKMVDVKSGDIIEDVSLDQIRKTS